MMLAAIEFLRDHFDALFRAGCVLGTVLLAAALGHILGELLGRAG